MEYDSLLPPGFHDISESEISNHFLSEFSTSTTRGLLIQGLQNFLTALRVCEIQYEIWIDGSFSTRKTDPNDIDLIVFASTEDINQLDLEKQEHIQTLFLDRVNTKQLYGCDAYFAMTEDSSGRSYWRGWFGFDRLERPKGIAKLVIKP
jgi:hypothetical protein